MRIVGEIERVGQPIGAAELATRFVAPERPVVLAGAASDWPAVRTWSPAVLVDKLGDIELPYKESRSHRHPDFRQTDLSVIFARGRQRLRPFLDAITKGPVGERSRRLFTGDEKFLLRRRDGQTTVDPELAPLLDDVRVPAQLPADNLYTMWAWMSGPGVFTWLHYDNNGCHNLNAQITGRKRCVLFPPEALDQMALFPPGGANPAVNCSQIDLEDPDLHRFPAFRDAEGLTATIEAGDLLFIPAWWFHAFWHLGDFNSNVNFWWTPERPPHPNPVSQREERLRTGASTSYG